jgi:hypothetical protein
MMIPVPAQDDHPARRYSCFCHGASAAARQGRNKMIRRSLFAMAACLATLSAFSGTVAIMTVGGAVSAEARVA